MILATLLVAAAAVVCLLTLENRYPRIEWLLKPTAALGFVLLALQAGALESNYGRTLLAGLLCCVCGDVLLIQKNDRAFIAGLASFLFGHLLFALAFTQLPDFHTTAMLWSALPACTLLALSMRWLWPYLSQPVSRAMRGPTLAYVGVIGLMLVVAGGSWGGTSALWILTGAWGFALSDLAVARQQFVKQTPLNRRWGLPLYFGSQMLLAWSSATV